MPPEKKHLKRVKFFYFRTTHSGAGFMRITGRFWSTSFLQRASRGWNLGPGLTAPGSKNPSVVILFIAATVKRNYTAC